MGQAKRRGTFEERKAQAIKEGREKKAKPNMRQLEKHVTGEFSDLLDTLFGSPSGQGGN